MKAMFFAAVILASPALASSSSIVLGPGSTLGVDGTSTLHPYSFNATVIHVSGEIVARKPRTLVVDIPVSDLHSGEAGMDKNMRKAMRSEQAPEIRFEFSKLEVVATEGDTTATVKATGTLAIAGATHETTIEAKCRYEATRIRIVGSKELLMSDFGIKAPTMMMGTIRTGNKVTVHFDLNLMAAADSVRAGSGGTR